MNKKFVAINAIKVEPFYCNRFEELLNHRAHEIDKCKGFIEMYVLKANNEIGQYLIISFWDCEENFLAWKNSESFIKGHQRGFDEMKTAISEGKKAPMHSDVITYTILTN